MRLYGYDISGEKRMFVDVVLGVARTQSVGKGSRPVADLSHVDADVGVEGARGDGEGMPLFTGNVGTLDEQPLSRFVFQRGRFDLNLDGIWGR